MKRLSLFLALFLAIPAFGAPVTKLSLCTAQVQSQALRDGYRQILEARARTLQLSNSVQAFLIGVAPAEKPTSVADVYAVIEHTSSEFNCQGFLGGKEVHHIPLELTGPNLLQLPQSSLIFAQPAIYDVMPQGSKLAQMHTTMFVGKAINVASQEEFVAKLQDHVEHVRRVFINRGLKGYIVEMGFGFEIALMSWESERAMQDAFATADGQSAGAEAAGFLQNIQFTGENPFQSTLATGHLYRLK